MNRNRYALGLVIGMLVIFIAAPIAAARHEVAKGQSVTVTMKEYKFTFSKTALIAGKVTFKLVNKGKLAHDLSIAGKTSALIQPGKTGTLVVALRKGKVPYKCTVPGHAALGMKGTLKVA